MAIYIRAGLRLADVDKWATAAPQGSRYTHERMAGNDVVSVVPFAAAVAQSGERWIVDPGNVGSNAIRGARLHDPVGEWLSHEAFNLGIVSSNLVRITSVASAAQQWPTVSSRIGDSQGWRAYPV